MDRDRRTRTGARAPGVERQKPFERRCTSAHRPPAQNGEPTREAGSTEDEGKLIDARDALHGQALSDIPALKPYRGKPAVRNFREGNGNVGIMRSPLRAIALPDQSQSVCLQAFFFRTDEAKQEYLDATALAEAAACTIPLC